MAFIQRTKVRQTGKDLGKGNFALCHGNVSSQSSWKTTEDSPKVKCIYPRIKLSYFWDTGRANGASVSRGPCTFTSIAPLPGGWRREQERTISSGIGKENKARVNSFHFNSMLELNTARANQINYAQKNKCQMMYLFRQPKKDKFIDVYSGTVATKS